MKKNLNMISLRWLASALALPLAAWPLRAEPVSSNGIAATVNGEIITYYEILTDRQYRHDDALARVQYHDAELKAHLRQLKLATRERLIDERLIIQDFKVRGGTYSDSYLDGEIQSVIDEHYGGSEARFSTILAKFGETREEYREGLYTHDVVYWQTKENVDKKVLPTTTIDDAAKQRDKLRAKWIDSLKINAFIEIMS
jgi:hypothetical protein